MTRRRQHRFQTHVVVLAAGLLTPALIAQRDGAGRGKVASATLPESNEALLYTSRVEEALQAGDYRLAVELIDRLMGLPGGLVAAPASRTYYPAWRQALWLLARLPEQGVQIYRQLHDAEVWARFEEAAAGADVNALRELFRSYRLSTAWAAIGVELTAHLLDQGAFGEAIEVLREMTSAGGGAGGDSLPAGSEPGRHSGVGAAPEHEAQLVAALASAGALRPAERLLAELRAGAELQARPEWRDRLERLDHWLAGLGAYRMGLPAGQQRGLMPGVETGPVWAQALLSDGRGRLADEGHDIAEAVGITRRLPLQRPVLAAAADGGLLVRQHGRLWAVDADTLILRWCVPEQPKDGAAGVFSSAVPGGRGAGVSPADGGGGVRLSQDAWLFISNPLRHAISVGFGKVYTVEGLTLHDANLGAFGRRPLGAPREAIRRNELVARELDSGRVAWRTAAEPAEPLFDVAFQNVPLVAGQSLVAPLVRGRELSLAVIDPADGRLIREVPLVGPPNRFPDEGGRCLMVSDETTLYVCTGNGVVAALARDDLSWKWATAYPSTLAQHLGQLWWQPQRKEQELSVDPPVTADDLLIVAPVDSDPPAIFALDRFSGRERWRMSRREYPFLLGLVGRGLVVGGHVVACLDLNDPTGRPPWWKSVPLRITGRAAIRDERIYVPTREGLVVLDGRTGKVLADQIETDATKREAAPPVPDRTANLLVGDDALFSVSPSRIVKYPDLRRARARYSAGPTGADVSDRTALVRAWLDTLDGRYDDALACLQTRAFDDPQFSAARDRLLKYVFLGLAGDAPAGEDRLGWLHRALALADSPQSAARLAITIGQALEAARCWPAALQHYGELLCQPDVCYVADTADAERRVAAWLHAAERIRAIGDEAPAASMEELLRQALHAGEHDEDRAVNLQRLRVALPNGAVREQVDRLLSMQKLSPELKIRYLPGGDAATLPAGLRRRLHLERWDTHVSLGLLDQARDDRAVWQAQFANSQAPGASTSQLAGFQPLGPEKEAERVGAIELAFRKLAQGGGAPFRQQFVRQWRIERAELLLDSRRPLTALGTSATGGGRYILVADLGNRRIELINAYKHEHPQRQTEDRMIADGFGRDGAGPLPHGQVEERQFGWDRGRPSTWPVIVYRQLAAVPVTGGLVCVGLGPERYAGRRQWQYAVPEWDVVPADFAERSVAGRQGVFLAPRRDRVGLVGWLDGQLWWQRELPGVTIDRLYLVEGSGFGFADYTARGAVPHYGVQALGEETPAAEERPRRSAGAADDLLVIVADDQRVWIIDATFGRRLQRVPTGITAPRRIDVVGDTIVVWGPESVVGIAGRTLRQLWSRPCPPVADAVTVPQRPWIAYRARDDLEWHWLDVRDGKAVFETSLGAFGSISAIVADGDRLFVAGRAGLASEGEQTEVVRVVAIDAADGARHWSRDFGTSVAVNATQLAAHPQYVPVLLVPFHDDRSASDDSLLPAIQLVNKRDGAVSVPFSITEDCRRAVEATCEMYMLATPTRMIVQAGGNLVAYGNSPLRSTP